MVLGYLTDEICLKVQVRFKLRPLTMIIIQLTIIIVIMYLVERSFSRRYNNEWRGKTPRFWFTSFFFLMQVTLFKNLLDVKRSMSFVKNE